jgi:hypothetical protein
MSAPEPYAQRRFEMTDQTEFAVLSGDTNPIHLDALAARRTLFGSPVVHGVHLVLWTLESLLAGDASAVPRRIIVNFSKPCFLGEAVTATVRRRDEQNVRITVASGGFGLTDIRVEFGSRLSPSADDWVAKTGRQEPNELSFGQLAGRAGELAIAPPVGADVLFPSLCAAIGAPSVAHIAALSRLVGMECPGLHSVFAGFDVELTGDAYGTGLTWSVARTDDRFAMVTMDVRSVLLAGTVRAFVRPRPAEQASMADLADVVRSGEFEESTALVVGGSRGLGEVAAKVIATGGGRVVVTFQRGADDARRVVAEIEAAGGRAAAVQLDVDDVDTAFHELVQRRIVPTHLLYFASPRIFARRTGLFDDELFRQFNAVYLSGFVTTIAACRAIGATKLRVFYPSTVAITEVAPDLREYSAAKLAAESAIESLNRSEPWLDVVVRRLPRLPTDQTATLSTVEEADPVAVIVEAVRATFATPDPSGSHVTSPKAENGG